jgi:hypothetical protein
MCKMVKQKWLRRFALKWKWKFANLVRFSLRFSLRLALDKLQHMNLNIYGHTGCSWSPRKVSNSLSDDISWKLKVGRVWFAFFKAKAKACVKVRKPLANPANKYAQHQHHRAIWKKVLYVQCSLHLEYRLSFNDLSLLLCFTFSSGGWRRGNPIIEISLQVKVFDIAVVSYYYYFLVCNNSHVSISLFFFFIISFISCQTLCRENKLDRDLRNCIWDDVAVLNLVIARYPNSLIPPHANNNVNLAANVPVTV